MRIYISADIEGVAGVVTGAHTSPSGFEYERARRWMTAEVVAACEAAFKAGASAIVVSDSHGSGENLLLEELPDRVEVVRSWPRPLSMMQGLETGPFAAALLLGYHSGAHHENGIMAHTITGEILALRLNGMAASETVLSAAIAGHFDVPVALATGDDAYCAHAREVLAGVETAEVKWAHGSLAARTMKPSAACALIAQKTTVALAGLAALRPFVLDPPITVDVTLRGRLQAELLDYLPYVERTGATSVRHVAQDMVAASKFLEFITTYKPHD